MTLLPNAVLAMPCVPQAVQPPADGLSTVGGAIALVWGFTLVLFVAKNLLNPRMPGRQGEPAAGGSEAFAIDYP